MTSGNRLERNHSAHISPRACVFALCSPILRLPAAPPRYPFRRQPGVSLARRSEKFKCHAMRLVLYIKTMGVEPVPIQHTGYRAWAAALQQQYEKLKAELDPEVFMQARTAARAQIKQHTLPVAAQGLLPPVPNAPPKPRPKKTLQVRSRPQKPTAYSPAQNTSAPPLPERTAPGRKLVRKCRRKLAHFDFLSALIHARHHSRHFGDHNLNIYPCQVCNGIHIGHRKTNKNTTGKI